MFLYNFFSGLHLSKFWGHYFRISFFICLNSAYLMDY